MTALLETWIARLTREAEDLDLRDPDDRGNFIVRVSEATKGAKCALLQKLADEMGARRAVTRRTLVLAIAHRFMMTMTNCA